MIVEAFFFIAVLFVLVVAFTAGPRRNRDGHGCDSHPNHQFFHILQQFGNISGTVLTTRVAECRLA
jgi:hypothetical protein